MLNALGENECRSSVMQLRNYAFCENRWSGNLSLIEGRSCCNTGDALSIFSVHLIKFYVEDLRTMTVSACALCEGHYEESHTLLEA